MFCSARGGTAERLARDRRVHTFRRGQTLFHAGDPALAIHVVRSGRVRVYSHWRDGHEQVLRLLGAGEIIGYRPVLAGESYNATAEAVVDTAVCIIPAEAVRGMILADPDLAMSMLAKLAREMRHSEELMMELVHRPVGQRVARLLLSLLESGAAPEPERSISAREMTRRDMARMVGTTPETISRVLRSFAQRGVVAVSRASVRVRDLERLRHAAGEHSTEN